jgi:thymidylate kinase
MKLFRTKIIELFGLPKTGKTTSVLALKKQLMAQGKKVEIVKERASLCPIKDKLHPFFNYWTTVSFMKEYIEADDKSVDIVIADRGVLDSYIWINLLSKRLGKDEYIASFENFVTQNVILENYLLSLCFSASTKTILQREKDRQIIKSSGRVMNEEILNCYSETYAGLKNALTKISSITEIDSNVTGIEEVLTQVAIAVNSKLQK